MQRAMLMLSIVAVGCGGCASNRVPRFDADAVRRILTTQAQAWNDGDVESFMEPYWQSPGLTFCAQGEVTRGWDETLRRYRERYPNRDDMGHLDFSDLEITVLEDNVAVVVGRWHVQRAAPIGGMFTLVLHRVDGEWVIKYDHTSVSPPASK